MLDGTDFYDGLDKLIERRQGTRLGSDPLDSEAGFAFAVLSNRAEVKTWTPPDDAMREAGQRRESALLAEAQELVDAGVARWVGDDLTRREIAAR
jgi:hypothetical protein